MPGKPRGRSVSEVRLGNSCLTMSGVVSMSHPDSERRGVRVGHTRLSTVLQTLDQQNDALAAANVTKDVLRRIAAALGRARQLVRCTFARASRQPRRPR